MATAHGSSNRFGPCFSTSLSRQPYIASGSPRRPLVVLCSLTRNASMGPVLDVGDPDGATLPALELVRDEEDKEDRGLFPDQQVAQAHAWNRPHRYGHLA